MKKLSHRIRLNNLKYFGLVALFATSSLTFSQESDSNSGEAVFELSPFEVDGSQDQGYLAANSLAGSRLNTSLRDISSVIDVYTPEFMDDLAATDLQDVVAYANNLVQDTEDDTHGFANRQIGANTSFNYRIRGLPAARGRNYFEYGFIFDDYIVERYDESRGPNAILFGFGSPGGIVNMSTKRAHFGKQKGRLEFTRGTEIKGRMEFDFNQILIEDKVAFRVNVLSHEEEGWKTYTHDDRDAYDVAITLRPFKKTKIFLDYENYDQNDEPSRPFNHHDQAEKWAAIGSPILAGGWGKRNDKNLNPDLSSTDIGHMSQVAGTNDNNKDGYWVFTSNTDQLANWRGLVKARWPNGKKEDGSNLTFFNGGRNVVLEPEGILAVNVFGPSNFRDLNIENKTAIIQQEVLENLHFEFAATQNTVDWYVLSQNASHLQGDPNAWLPKAAVTDTLPDPNNPVNNPFAGMFYFETATMDRLQDQELTSWRISGSYELDFNKILGSNKMGDILGVHRIAALYEDSEYEVEEVQRRENILIDGELPRPDLPDNARNRVIRRNYIEDPSDPLSYTIGEYSPLNYTLDDGSTVTSEFLPFKRRFDFTRFNESKMIALQSFWFGGKLVTSLGKRQDDLEFQAYGEMQDKTNGIKAVRDPDSLTISNFKGSTQLIGAVYHVTNDFSVFVNQSDSIGVPDFPRTMVPDGAFNSPTEGDGTDMGLKLSLFDSKLSVVATRFTAAQKNDTRGGNPDNWGQERIVDALILDGLLSESEAEQYRLYGNGHTWDTETEGYELSVVGRITRNWNIRFNYSWTDKEITNIAPRIVKWIEEVGRPFWSSYDRDNPNTAELDNILDTVFIDNGDTLRERIESFEGQLQEIIDDGTTLRGLRKDKVSVFTNYEFHDGFLKGLGVGAGMRYMSAPVIGQDPDGLDWFGKSNTSYDFLVKYKTKIMDRNVSFQMNVRNAFRDAVEWSPISRVYGDNIDAIVVFPPREFLFTVRYDF